MKILETMTVGPLELRRTEEGWQYLSEGLGGEPDRWGDATASLGPFSGSGINGLLSAISAANARENELVETLKHIRGKSSCCDAWDTIDEVVPYDEKLYS